MMPERKVAVTYPLVSLEAYAAKFPGRVRFVVEPGTGPREAWNAGLKIAKGEIFGCIGVDDICEERAIQTVVEFFQSHPDARFVHGECDLINDREKIIGRHRVEDFNFQAYIDTAKHIATPSAFYRRCVLEKVGWLDSSGDDFGLMIRIAKEFKA